MMIKRFALALLASLALAMPALAAPSKAELLQRAAEGAAICAEAMPDSRATSSLLSSRGFRLEQTDGAVKAYSSHGRRVVVAITHSSSSMDGCLILVSRMTTAEAEALIQPWLASSGAQPIRGDALPFAKGWMGLFKGGAVQLLIDDYIDLGIVRGAAIVARAYTQ